MTPIGTLIGSAAIVAGGTGLLSDTHSVWLSVFNLVPLIAGSIIVSSFLITRILRWLL